MCCVVTCMQLLCSWMDVDNTIVIITAMGMPLPVHTIHVATNCRFSILQYPLFHGKVNGQKVPCLVAILNSLD